MRHVWSVLCSSSTIDRDSNNISLNEVTEQLNIPAEEMPDDLPEDAGIPVQLELVTLWSRSDLEEEDEGEARLVLDTPEGNQIEGEPVAVDLREFRRFRTRQGFNGLPYDGPGLYEFRIQARRGPDQEWEERAWIPLEVRIRDTEEN